MKRFLDCNASDFEKMTKEELLAAIAGSEGRVLVCETIGVIQPMLGDITYAEFVAAMGADVILLNIFDVNKPVINGLPTVEPENVIRKLKELHPDANIVPIDYDASATKVNQENRIKLMLSIARENLASKDEAND